VWQTEYYCCTTGPGNFSYTIPKLTPGTTYQVRLDFSENYSNAAGAREFNVVINGVQVLMNFDAA